MAQVATGAAMNGFYVSSGLLTPEHKQRIGPALWEFLWLIDHETRDGKVLKGARIPLSRISQELGQHKNTTWRHLDLLVREGYITQTSDASGRAACSYTVVNSKKWKAEAVPVTKNGDSPGPEPAAPLSPEMVTAITRNGDSLSPEMVTAITRNGDSNKESRQYETKETSETGGNGNGKPSPAPQNLVPLYSRDYAQRILDDVHLPNDPRKENLRTVIAAIECEVKSGGHGSTLAAYEFIRTGCKEAQEQDIPINAYFFQDARYRIENRRKTVKTFAQMRQEGNHDAHRQVDEYIERKYRSS